jgi:hypothetical protein
MFNGIFYMNYLSTNTCRKEIRLIGTSSLELNGEPESVGYFPKSLLPGLIDNPVEISFGGYVIHKKPRLSPPMGSGYVSGSGNAASFSNLRLIDEDEHDYFISKDLPYSADMRGCYTPTSIDSSQFFYRGTGCVD